MITDETLEEFLTAAGVAWNVIPAARHQSLANEWEQIYGRHFVGSVRLRHRSGAKAEFEYAKEQAVQFTIVPFLGTRAGPHGLSKPGPRTAAYECRGGGSLPDLSSFAKLDFFIVPADWSWTMVHTHEDHTLGGPYFVRREWLGFEDGRVVEPGS